MDATRGATVNGRPVRDQAEAAVFIEGVIKKQMENALSSDDKALMMKANSKLLTHATVGMWLGSMVGAAWVFRSRFTAGRRAAAKAAAGGPSANTTPPRLFYPANESDPTGRGAANGPKAAQSRLSAIARGLGWGMLGAFVGSQIGVATGTRAAQKVIKESGHEDRIAKNLKRAMDQAVEEIRRSSTGLESATNPLLKRSTPFGRIDGTTPGNTDGFTPDDASDHSGPADDRDAFLSQDSNARPNSNSSSRADPAGPSRWDELRKSRAAPPSTWDTIRESSSRGDVPAPSPEDVSSSDGQSYSSGLGAGGASAAEREARRKKFEELMEQERRGSDNAGGDESFDGGKWK